MPEVREFVKRRVGYRSDTFSCSLQQPEHDYYRTTQSAYFLYRCRRTKRIMRHGRPAWRPGPPPSRPSDAALWLPAAALAAQSRAGELLIAAATHRISVDHWLQKQQIEQQQTAMADIKLTVSPEMIEAWMTVEDAVEVASWHMKAGQGGSCALASQVLEEDFAAAFSGHAEPPRALSEKPLMATNWP